MITELQQYFFIIVLTIASVAVVSISIYSIIVAHRLVDFHAPLVDAAMEIKYELTITKLNLEGFISGSESITESDITSHLKQAKWYAHAMLSGGQNSEGIFIPLEDKGLRDNIRTDQTD